MPSLPEEGRYQEGLFGACALRRAEFSVQDPEIGSPALVDCRFGQDVSDALTQPLGLGGQDRLDQVLPEPSNGDALSRVAEVAVAVGVLRLGQLFAESTNPNLLAGRPRVPQP